MPPPDPSEEEEDTNDLLLEADDEEFRGALKRGRDAVEGVVNRIVGVVKEMRKAKKKRTKVKPTARSMRWAKDPESGPVLRPSLPERLHKQKLIPGADIALEMAIVRPIVVAMFVPDALRLTSVLRSVRELLWNDDEIWRAWWRRDFPEVRRDLGENETSQPPSWILENAWKAALPGVNPQHVPYILARSARMPWRCWYQWSEFFRRSALHHAAQLFNTIAIEWREDHALEIALDVIPEFDEGRPPNVLWNGEVVILRVPWYGQDLGVARGLVLVDSAKQDDIWFPEELFDDNIDAELTTAPTAQSAVIANARSPVYWLLVAIAKEAFALGTNLVDVWNRVVDLRDLEFETLLLGGKTMIPGQGQLNFDYKKVLSLYCSWYASEIQPGHGVVPLFFMNFAPLRLKYSTPNAVKRTAALAKDLSKTLPAFPSLGGTVWFVGEEVRPVWTISDKVRPMCVGCHAPGHPTVRCKGCGSGYCGVDCHAKNGQRRCAGCGGK